MFPAVVIRYVSLKVIHRDLFVCLLLFLSFFFAYCFINVTRATFVKLK